MALNLLVIIEETLFILQDNNNVYEVAINLHLDATEENKIPRKHIVGKMAKRREHNY